MRTNREQIQNGPEQTVNIRQAEQNVNAWPPAIAACKHADMRRDRTRPACVAAWRGQVPGPCQACGREPSRSQAAQGPACDPPQGHGTGPQDASRHRMNKLCGLPLLVSQGIACSKTNRNESGTKERKGDRSQESPRTYRETGQVCLACHLHSLAPTLPSHPCFRSIAPI